MARGGWFLVSRKLVFTYEFWSYERIGIWLEILGMTAYETRLLRNGAMLEEGEVFLSGRRCARRWEWTHKQARWFLEELVERESLDVVRPTPFGTIYRVVNWLSYQRPHVASQGHTPGHRFWHTNVAQPRGSSELRGTGQGTPQGTPSSKEEEERIRKRKKEAVELALAAFNDRRTKLGWLPLTATAETAYLRRQLRTGMTPTEIAQAADGCFRAAVSGDTWLIAQRALRPTPVPNPKNVQKYLDLGARPRLRKTPKTLPSPSERAP